MTRKIEAVLFFKTLNLAFLFSYVISLIDHPACILK